MIDSVSDISGAGANLKRRSQARRTDRLPPNSFEAEQGVLGCVLLSPNECMGECIKKLKYDGQQVFYDLRHQAIYENVSAMYDAREAIDVITLQQRLHDKQLLEQIGGIDYLSQLQDVVPSAANLSYYLDIILEKHVLRKTIQVCSDIVGKAHSYEGVVDTLLDAVEREVLAIRPRHRKKVLATVQELVNDSIVHIEDLSARKGEISGLKTGFKDLDMMMDGLHDAEVSVIASFPGFGKTTLACNIAENVSLVEGKAVGIFSLEMTAKQLVTRTICSHARVNLRNINQGILIEEDVSKLKVAAGGIAKAKIFIDDTSDLTVYEIRSRARAWQQEHDIRLLVVDYVQLLKAPSKGKSHRTESEELAEVSHQLLQMAKELNVPLIVLSQLTAKSDGGSKLRGSADIGQDAHNVLRIDNVKRKADEEKRKTSEGTLVNLSILKQRNGPTGIVKLVFMKQFTRFESFAYDKEETTGEENGH